MSENTRRAPVLISVRGWNELVNPAYPRFLEELRASGEEVIDIYLGPAGFEDLGQWGRAVADAIVELEIDGPLQIVSYCFGGIITHVALVELVSRGVDIEFVALIDVRQETPVFRLERGLESLYRVPWPVRIRQQLVRVTAPDRESLPAVLRSNLRRAIRSTAEFPSRGWRSRSRRTDAIFDEMRIAHWWEFESLTIPVHLYNTTDSIERFGAGDPSVGLGTILRGGAAFRLVEGTHETCIEPPHSTALIERILRDRRAALAGEVVL